MSHTVSIRPVLSDITFCEDDFPLLTASANLPQLDGRGSHRFQRYYAACATAFERWCRYQILPQAQLLYRHALETATPIPQWHATLQTVVTCHTDRILSLYTETVLSGAPQRTVLRRADTWDLRHGLPMTITEFFHPICHGVRCCCAKPANKSSSKKHRVSPYTIPSGARSCAVTSIHSAFT